MSSITKECSCEDKEKTIFMTFPDLGAFAVVCNPCFDANKNIANRAFVIKTKKEIPL